MNCTSMDHLYPPSANGAKPADGTACFCGARRWNQDGTDYRGPSERAVPVRLPRRGSLVRLVIDGLDTLWSVDQVDREGGMFHVEGKGWHEPGEIIR